MLQSLRLTNFKSFADEKVALAPLTLLVGANASGKSNFLDAIHFLRATHFDLSFDEILNGEERSSPDAWPGIRGGALEAARVGTSSFAIESGWRAPDPNERASKNNGSGRRWYDLIHRIACRTTPHAKLEAESLARGDGKPLFATGKHIGERVEVPGWKRIPWPGEKTSPALLDTDRTLLWVILGSINPGSPRVPTAVSRYAHALSVAMSHIEFLDIKPEQMRGYGRKGAPLGNEGKNISGALAEICERPDDKRGLVTWLMEVCAPEVADIDFVGIKELGDVMAIFVEKGGKRISARSFSDGTLRFLGTMLALRMAAPGTVMLIEEIEAGLHPTRIRLLVEYLETVARERNIQIIATTHSPVVLQWLSEGALRSTLVFGRVPEHEGTIIRRLGDLPHFEQVAQRTGIEELFTTGWLEMAL